MSTNTVSLLLGSNLGDRKSYLNVAKQIIEKDIGEILKETVVIETEPEGFISENLFLNQIIWIRCSFGPIQLLDKLQFIEKKIGRSKKRTQASPEYLDREIDLDLLTFNNILFFSSRLIIPHPQIYERKFFQELKFYENKFLV